MNLMFETIKIFIICLKVFLTCKGIPPDVRFFFVRKIFTVFTDLLTYKLLKNLELNSNSMGITWRCFGQVHRDLSLHCEDFENSEYQF